VVIRATFGIYGAYWPVFSRSVLDLVWYGIQTVFGGTFLDVSFMCIFGSSWTNIPNHLPESASITTRGMTAFFLYWCIQFTSNFFRPHEMKWMYYTKAILMPINIFGLFIFAMVRSGGPGTFQLGAYASSQSALIWAVVASINSAINGNFGPLVASGQDITRFARSPRDQTIGQSLTAPWSATIVALLGVVTAACSQQIYGTAYWQPALLLTAILGEDDSSKTRFAVLCSAATFVFGQICTNYVANVVPFGSDATALWPRQINYIRAAVICTLVGGWLMVPWKVAVDGATFLTAITGMGIFVSCLIGIMTADYYFVRNGNYFVDDLYSATEGSRYYYTKGFHWRAYAAYVCGVALPFPGFVGSLGVIALASEEGPAMQLYNIGYLLAFAVAFVVYYALCKIFPDASMKEAAAMRFEEMVGRDDEKYLDGEPASGENMVEELSLEGGEGEKRH
jgi:NCS1 family nucleobase:cation symporter-1